MSLSGRLALVSFMFVLLAEIIILVPALAFYRLNLLQERIDDAALVAAALLSTPARSADPEQAEMLLDRAVVHNIALVYEDRRERLLIPSQAIEITHTLDLRGLGLGPRLMNSVSCLNASRDAILRLIGTPSTAGPDIDITLREQPLCEQVGEFGRDLLFISLGVSLAAGGVLYFAVGWLLVGPIRRLTRSITGFRGRKEDRQNLIEPASDINEIQRAEGSLRDLQERILDALEQRERLATLGESVAKIQHDLRNMLATAQLVADNLGESRDAKVRKIAPRLMRALNRAITLSSQTLEYGRVGERKAQMKQFDIIPLFREVISEEASLSRDQKIAWAVELPDEMSAFADEGFLERVLTNITRNARQILAEVGGGTINISTNSSEGRLALLIGDDGPGMSAAAREHLFQPFKGSTRAGGTGLGLALANELCTLMDARIELLKSDQDGTLFAVFLLETAPALSLAKMAASG